MNVITYKGLECKLAILH